MFLFSHSFAFSCFFVLRLRFPIPSPPIVLLSSSLVWLSWLSAYFSSSVFFFLFPLFLFFDEIQVPWCRSSFAFCNVATRMLATTQGARKGEEEREKEKGAEQRGLNMKRAGVVGVGGGNDGEKCNGDTSKDGERQKGRVERVNWRCMQCTSGNGGDRRRCEPRTRWKHRDARGTHAGRALLQ